jgi:hypothetical protein
VAAARGEPAHAARGLHRLLGGANGATAPVPGSDEARNLDGDAVFVYREVSMAAGREFDDQLLWVPIHLVVSRLMSAGRLP